MKVREEWYEAARNTFWSHEEDHDGEMGVDVVKALRAVVDTLVPLIGGELRAPKQSLSLPAFPIRDGTVWFPDGELFARHAKAYPNIDVKAEYWKATEWLQSNPRLRKTHGGMPRFLTNWLSRAADRKPQPKPTLAKLPADIWERE